MAIDSTTGLGIGGGATVLASTATLARARTLARGATELHETSLRLADPAAARTLDQLAHARVGHALSHAKLGGALAAGGALLLAAAGIQQLTARS